MTLPLHCIAFSAFLFEFDAILLQFAGEHAFLVLLLLLRKEMGHPPVQQVTFLSLRGFFSHSFKNSSRNYEVHASIPPRGWNSYDSFCWTISEEEFLRSSEVVAEKLHKYGYEYVVVDYLWYRKKVPGAYVDSYGYDVIDEWGRMIPDPIRWPSSRNGKGFSEVARKVHDMGLKFGIHVMRGMSTQAFQANTSILDVTKGTAYVESDLIWRAQDIGLKERACAWMAHGFMSVNTNTGAGKAFLKSLYHQYAEWGVDFVKHDCVFGDDLDINEISYVSEVLKELDRPILYSLSPGTSVTPQMAKDVSGLVNMYRITGDDWDTWGDVASHFDVSRDFSTADMIGASGLLGKSWPDLDMLPLGKLTDPGSNEGPHRTCRLNMDEQRTQITLWAMAKSPFMFGGDVRSLDDSTFDIITNPIVLEINSFSSQNMEFPFISGENVRTRRTETYSLVSALYHGDVKEPKMDVLGLTSCKASGSSGWAVEEVNQVLESVCWKQNTKGRDEEPFCLYRRSSPPASDEEITGRDTQGKLHLSVSDAMDFCLGASPKRRLTSREFQRGSFYPCKWDANQMWEFNHNGTLSSSYSGLCAIVKRVKAKARNIGGLRSWIATGRKGEIYVAFFNLNEQKVVISTKVSDLAMALPGRKLRGTCKFKEVWSGAESGRAAEAISAPVERHGCALFILNCD